MCLSVNTLIEVVWMAWETVWVNSAGLRLMVDDPSCKYIPNIPQMTDPFMRSPTLDFDLKRRLIL